MVEEEQGYTTGKVSLGDADIKSISKETLRSRIGMVFQQPIAFPHSIEKNLTYVLKYYGIRDKKVLSEKVEESLKKAKLYEEVKDQLKKICPQVIRRTEAAPCNCQKSLCKS